VTRRTRTIVTLSAEAIMLLAMAGSFVYFIQNSHDFTLARPAASAVQGSGHEPAG